MTHSRPAVAAAESWTRRKGLDPLGHVSTQLKAEHGGEGGWELGLLFHAPIIGGMKVGKLDEGVQRLARVKCITPSAVTV